MMFRNAQFNMDYRTLYLDHHIVVLKKDTGRLMGAVEFASGVYVVRGRTLDVVLATKNLAQALEEIVTGFPSAASTVRSPLPTPPGSTASLSGTDNEKTGQSHPLPPEAGDLHG